MYYIYHLIQLLVGVKV